MTQTVVLLRLFPVWAQPAVARLLPSFWRCRHLIRSGQKLLGPYIRELLDKHDRGLWRPSTDPEDSNVLHWLVDMAKDKDRNPDTIGHIEVFMTMAAIQCVFYNETSWPLRLFHLPMLFLTSQLVGKPALVADVSLC